MSNVAIYRRTRAEAFRRLVLRVGIVGLLLSWFIFPQAALWQHASAASVSAADWLRHQTVVVLGGTPSKTSASTEVDIDKLSPVNGFPSSEIRCLALAMYHEAGGDRPDAQLAVAQVALNRAASFKSPKAICRAIYTGLNTPQGCLFGASCRNVGSTPAPSKTLTATIALAIEFAAGRTATKPAFENASQFHDMKISPPPWTRTAHRIGRLGRLDFYSPEPSPVTAATEATAVTGPTASNVSHTQRSQRPVPPPRRNTPGGDGPTRELANQVFGQ